MPEEKKLQLDRLVFFSDAIVAIAITLLALDLKVPHSPDHHITFQDVFAQWRSFAAFVLSFINIANFWRVHHSFFGYIHKIDERLMWFNIGWLFFIVLLPFSTTLVSASVTNTPAIFIYSLNILLIAVFQNTIWDYASIDGKFVDEKELGEFSIKQIRLFCNLDMLNGIIAIIVSWFAPVLAFILLFTKLPTIFIAGFIYRSRMRPHNRPGRPGRPKSVSPDESARP